MCARVCARVCVCVCVCVCVRIGMRVLAGVSKTTSRMLTVWIISHLKRYNNCLEPSCSLLFLSVIMLLYFLSERLQEFERERERERERQREGERERGRERDRERWIFYDRERKRHCSSCFNAFTLAILDSTLLILDSCIKHSLFNMAQWYFRENMFLTPLNTSHDVLTQEVIQRQPANEMLIELLTCAWFGDVKDLLVIPALHMLMTDNINAQIH